MEASPFPIAPTLDEVRAAVQGMVEFKCSTYAEGDGSELLFYNYRFCSPKTFPTVDGASPEDARMFLLRRECRGLVFRVLPDGSSKLEARMFHKFFNVGERADTDESRLDLSRPHSLLVKHDGSLVAPVMRHHGGVDFATKSGFTSVAALMKERFLVKNQHYEPWCKDWLERGYTPLFEWCSLRNKIVLEYQEDSLILLGIRHTESGRYLAHVKVAESATNGRIAVTTPLARSTLGMATSELLASIKSQVAVEGFVIAFEDSSELFKVKTEWYFARSNQKKKSENALSSERSVWAVVLQQTVDDVVVGMDPLLKAAVLSFSSDLFDAVNALHTRVKHEAKQHKTKRELVMALKQKKDPLLPDSLCFKVFDTLAVEDDVWELVRDWCVANTSSSARLEVARVALGGIKFSETLPEDEIDVPTELVKINDE